MAAHGGNLEPTRWPRPPGDEVYWFALGFKGEVNVSIETLWGSRAIVEGLDWIPFGGNPYPYNTETGTYVVMTGGGGGGGDDECKYDAGSLYLHDGRFLVSGAAF